MDAMIDRTEPKDGLISLIFSRRTLSRVEVMAVVNDSRRDSAHLHAYCYTSDKIGPARSQVGENS